MSIEFRRPADSSLPVDCPTPRSQKASGEAGYEGVSADDAQAFEQAMAREEAGISLDTDVATGAGAQAVPGTGTDPLPTPQDILSVWPGRQDELDLQQPQSHDADWHKTGLGEGDGIEAGFPSPDGQPIERSPGLIHKAHGAASDKSAGQPNAQSQGSWISKKLEPVPRHHGTTDANEMDANVTPLQQAAANAPPWAAPSPPDVPVPTPLAELIRDYVAQLLVDEGTHGRRSVHIELKDDTLTGVSVAVSENAGTLVSVFSCTNDTAFQKLGANADELARSLADALGRCTRVEVRRDDLQETRLIEASAQASR